ncbi:MAG: DsbA family protein [Usitatibacter sp.]
MHLLYIADPLCSWCYGFGPELAKLAARHPGVRIDLLMGGLRPYNREPMSEAFRTMLLEHWNHVAQASGLPFSRTAIDRPGFVYDTEPACRAVVAARTIDASRALAFMKAVQAAFYRDGRDATDDAVLAEIAAENGYGHRAFAAAIESGPMREATRDDFARSQTMGVGGFPTVAVMSGAQLYLVTSGYATDDVLEYRIGEIERRIAPTTARGA